MTWLSQVINPNVLKKIMIKKRKLFNYFKGHITDGYRSGYLKTYPYAKLKIITKKY